MQANNVPAFENTKVYRSRFKASRKSGKRNFTSYAKQSILFRHVAHSFAVVPNLAKRYKHKTIHGRSYNNYIQDIQKTTSDHFAIVSLYAAVLDLQVGCILHERQCVKYNSHMPTKSTVCLGITVCRRPPNQMPEILRSYDEDQGGGFIVRVSTLAVRFLQIVGCLLCRE